MDTHRKEPISIKNLHKGDAAWSKKKIILGWALDMTKHILTLPLHRVESVQKSLTLIKPKPPRIPIQWWRRLLRLLRRITPMVTREKRMFTCLQNALEYV